MRRVAWLLGLAAVIALGSDKASTGAASTNGGGDRWQFRLRLSAPQPDIQRDPASPQSLPVLRIPTFDSIPYEDAALAGRSREAAQLPVKVVRVAIPEGAEISLSTLQAPRRLLKGVRLGRGKATGQGWPGASASPTAAPAVGDPQASAPTSNKSEEGKDEAGRPFVRLGQVGYIRFQKFVEIVYTPVQPVDATDDLEFYPDVDVTLQVDGVDWDAVAESAAGLPEDPHFEDVYRQGLVNYDEGRAFRSRRVGHDEFSSLTTTTGTGSGASLVPPKPYPFAGATTPIYRINIDADGIYRMTWSYLLAPGTGVAPGLAGVNPTTFKMMSQGVEIPIRVVTAVAGTFASGDYIEFYGTGMLNEAKLIHNASPPGAPEVLQVNDFTDENAYFLFGQTGTRLRIPDLTGTVQGALPVETAFTGTVHREYDMRFIPDGISDPFYQFPEHTTSVSRVAPDPNLPNCGYSNPGVQTRPPYWGPASDPNSTACAACDLNLPTADPSGGANVATVRVRMRGLNLQTVNPDHMTVVQVGTVASRSTTLCWDGEGSVEQTVSLAQSGLAGAGIYIGQPGLTTTPAEESVALDWINVENYRQALRLTSNQLYASFTNISRTYQIAGFPNSTAADLIVYDISRTVPGSTVASPRRVIGATVIQNTPTDFSFKYSLDLDPTLAGGVPRQFAAAGTGGFKTPVRVTAVPVVDLTATTNSADMIVITNPNVVGTPPTAAFTNYIAHREADSGLNLTVVMIGDIYDQFGNGVVTPEAIRSFLAYTLDNWHGSGSAAPPAYVLMLGDSSLDYKNILGNASWAEDVPTYMMYQANFFLDYYASDTYLSAVVGSDQLPDFHIGRITARNPTQLAVILSKLTNYDLSPPTGAWRARGLFLADKGNNPGETTEFEAISNKFADTYFTAPFNSQKLYFEDPNYANGDPTTGPPLWRADYVSKADAGAAITSYVGHGNFFDWGLFGLFTSDDVPLLSPTGRPSFVINENCLIGGFHFGFGTALGEDFMNADAKSAIAVLAPSGLSFSTAADTINTAIYSQMFGLTKERKFGNLVTQAKLALSLSLSDLQAYVLLGDPAQRLILPAPRPPKNFAAVTGQNAHVDLSWTPGPDTGVTTRIYRREAMLSTYTLLNPGGAAGTSYNDTSVINGKSYFYRAVSYDAAGGFEGAVTNLNATCNFTDPNSSGSDCVWATPRNPNPPAAPTGLLIGNPGNGNSLDVSWNTSPEPDINRYTIRYGTTSGGPYTFSFNVQAPGTSASIGGLTTNVTYYFVVTATNFTGLTSSFSQQAAGLPQVYEGIAPPDMVTTLDVRRSGPSPSSIELLWSAPAVDIYGGPTQVGSFSIYRGTLPTFAAGTSTRITTINNPSAGSYTDPGAYTAPPNYFYLVTAADLDGFSSGAGRQLPKGITDLALAVSGSNINMTWSPVTQDIDGNPTSVDHYVLYSDTLPVDRERIESLTPIVPVIVGPSVTTPIPGGVVFYTVIVIDVKGNKSPF